MTRQSKSFVHLIWDEKNWFTEISYSYAMNSSWVCLHVLYLSDYDSCPLWKEYLNVENYMRGVAAHTHGQTDTDNENTQTQKQASGKNPS